MSTIGILTELIQAPKPTEDAISDILEYLTFTEKVALLGDMLVNPVIISSSDQTWEQVVDNLLVDALHEHRSNTEKDPVAEEKYKVDVIYYFSILDEEPLSEKEKTQAILACYNAGYKPDVAAEVIAEAREHPW